MAGVKKLYRARGAWLGILIGGMVPYSPVLADQAGASDRSGGQQSAPGSQEPAWFHYSGIELATSDVGSSRQVLESEISRKLDERKSVFARLRLGREVDPTYVNSLFRRLGIGMNYTTMHGHEFRAEISGGIDTGKEGYLLAGRIQQNDRLTLKASHTSFADDVPMPAIANGIHADRYLAGVEFHGEGWRYEGDAALKSYKFSDSNSRQVFESSIAYSYHRVPERWRRVGVSIFHQQNSLAGAAYFNPVNATTVSLYHLWELPGQTRFLNLKNLFTVRAGISQQAGYPSGVVGELRYERKYTVSKHSWMEMSAALASNVYDGNREAEMSARLSYSREF